jgi:hypothetical protein
MKSNATRIVLLLLLMGAVLPARAQFEKMPGFVKQIEIGYGYSFCSADYIIKATGVVPDGTRTVDTTIKTRVHTKGGMTETFGTSLKLKRLGTKSTLALGVDMTYSAYLWDFHMPTGGTLIDSGFRFYYDDFMPAFDGASFTAAGLLTLDFKFGTDAMMDKQYRWGWTIGGGVMPSMRATTAEGLDADLKFGIQPVVKGEMAFRGPIVAKLRLQYSMGNITFLDKSGDGLVPGTAQQTQIVGKSNFTVSIILLPLSFMYKTSTWYNSY